MAHNKQKRGERPTPNKTGQEENGKGAAAIGCNERGGKPPRAGGRPGGGAGPRNASQAAEAAWLGYEWLRPLERDPEARMLTTSEVSGAVRRVLDAHKADLPHSCLWLSLLAFCGSPDDVAFVDRLWSRAPTLAQMRDVVVKFARKSGSRIALWECSRPYHETERTITFGAYTVDQVATLGNGERHKCLVILMPESDGEPFHALPFVSPNREARVVVEPLLPPSVEPVVPMDVATSSAANAAPELAAWEKAALQQVADLGLTPIKPTIRGNGLSASAIVFSTWIVALAFRGWRGQRVALPGSSRDVEDPPLFQIPIAGMTDSRSSSPEPVLVERRDATPPRKAPFPAYRSCDDSALSFEWPDVYRGVYPPPPGFLWEAGWWASTCPRASGIIRQAAADLIIPSLCSATLDNVGRYQDLCLYLPLPEGFDKWKLGNRTLTDGLESVGYFSEGDVIQVGAFEYVARKHIQYGFDTLALLPAKASIRERVKWGLLGTLKARTGAAQTARVVAMGDAPEVDVRDKEFAKWTFEVHAQSDPVSTAVLTHMKQTAAQMGFDGSVNAHEASRWVNAVAKRFPNSKGVHGRFAWGYCYSCGAELPGKMNQRLCKSCFAGINSELGEEVAQGLHVCNHRVPVRYPGVVNTQTRHPGLKVGTRTIATSANFPSAPPLLKKSYVVSQFAAVVRDLAEWE